MANRYRVLSSTGLLIDDVQLIGNLLKKKVEFKPLVV